MQASMCTLAARTPLPLQVCTCQSAAPAAAVALHLLEPAAQQSPARSAPLAMSYRGRSRSRSRSRERGRSREDRGGERVSVLVRNLPLDAR